MPRHQEVGLRQDSLTGLDHIPKEITNADNSCGAARGETATNVILYTVSYRNMPCTL